MATQKFLTWLSEQADQEIGSINRAKSIRPQTPQRVLYEK